MTHATPWLSVVMPIYNGAAYLGAALESVAAECEAFGGSASEAGVEVVAVDDGSTDASPTIVESFAGRLSVQLLSQPHGGNWTAATNRGLAAAHGRHACVLHQDDLWRPGRLAEVQAMLAECAEAALLLHAVEFIDRAGRGVGAWRCPLPRGGIAPGLLLDRLLVQNFIAMPAPVFPRELALQSGGFDEGLRYTADWDLWLRLAAAGPACYRPRPLAGFRLHAESQTANFPLEAFRQELETTLARHLARRAKVSAALRRAAQFSIEVNAALAARYHGRPISRTALLCAGFGLGPAGWRRYLRDSRIGERVRARLRAGLLAHRS